MTFDCVRNSVFATADGSLINCEVEHITHGWIPFAAGANDVEQQGRDLYAALIAGEHGPIASYGPPPPPSAQELAAQVRGRRDALLLGCDWTQLPDAQAALSSEKKSEWSAYRSSLRDITKQPGFPEMVEWPQTP